jgi:NAD(P)-dependent dehydrogenase (short-subunit alcohol dehydrogenase family)
VPSTRSSIADIWPDVKSRIPRLDEMNKVAVVTGASRGIGAATASQFAARGWDVAVGYRQDVSAADSVVENCRSAGCRAVALRVDVAKEDEIVKMFINVDEELGPLSALVNCAGVVDQKARVDEYPSGRVERMFAINVVGSFLCAREAVRRMSTTHGGSGGAIVNVSSAAVRLGSPGEYVDYAASKAAIDTMTIGLAREIAQEGVRVNAVRPGLVETTMHASGGQPDRATRLAPAIPMARAGQPSEIAHAIVWLCSDEASYVTGALLDVSGGR